MAALVGLGEREKAETMRTLMLVNTVRAIVGATPMPMPGEGPRITPMSPEAIANMERHFAERDAKRLATSSPEAPA